MLIDIMKLMNVIFNVYMTEITFHISVIRITFIEIN